jgi:hypothetical protein
MGAWISAMPGGMFAGNRTPSLDSIVIAAIAHVASRPARRPGPAPVTVRVVDA